MDTSEKDTDEGTEQDWLPEASKQAVRRQPDYQRVDTACDACQ